MKLTSPQQKQHDDRLVKAAATEKYTSKQSGNGSFSKRGGSKGWGRVRGHGKQSFDNAYKVSRSQSSHDSEGRDDFQKSDFLGRCNITVNEVRGRNTAAPEIKPARAQVHKERRHSDQDVEGEEKRRVKFHKYDELIYTDCREYVYSLHDVEIEEEAENFDVMDEFEQGVRDVGYFFRCLKEGIQEEARKKLTRRRQVNAKDLR